MQSFLTRLETQTQERNKPMPRIEVSTGEDCPDSMPKVDPGIYTVVVTESDYAPAKKESSGHNIKLTLKISDGPFEGRSLFTYINIHPQHPPISLKQAQKAAGLPTGKGFNTEDFIGKTMKVRVKTRTYKDPETGEVKETPSVDEYLS